MQYLGIGFIQLRAAVNGLILIVERQRAICNLACKKQLIEGYLFGLIGVERACFEIANQRLSIHFVLPMPQMVQLICHSPLADAPKFRCPPVAAKRPQIHLPCQTPKPAIN